MRPALGKPFSTRLEPLAGDLAIVVDPAMRLLAGHEMSTLRRLANAALSATQDDAAPFEVEGERFEAEWDDSRGNVPVIVVTRACREADADVAAQALAEGPVPDLVKISEAALLMLKLRAAHAARSSLPKAAGLGTVQLGILLYVADLRHLTALPFAHRGDRTQIGHDRHLAKAAGPLGANLEAILEGNPAILMAMGLGSSPFRRRGGLVEGRRDPRMGVFAESEARVLEDTASAFAGMDEDDMRETCMRGLVAWRQARRDARLPAGGPLEEGGEPDDAVHGAPAIDILVDAARWAQNGDESIAYAREKLARARYDR